jgi:hypothetical protein
MGDVIFKGRIKKSGREEKRWPMMNCTIPTTAPSDQKRIWWYS